MSAVQRHRELTCQITFLAKGNTGATILECLKDPDVSIRQRALELTYQLVNSSNIQELVREMLNYLIVSAPEHKAALCSRVQPLCHCPKFFLILLKGLCCCEEVTGLRAAS